VWFRVVSWLNIFSVSFIELTLFTIYGFSTDCYARKEANNADAESTGESRRETDRQHRAR